MPCKVIILEKVPGPKGIQVLLIIVLRVGEKAKFFAGYVVEAMEDDVGGSWGRGGLEGC